jgi:hypothetical protein
MIRRQNNNQWSDGKAAHPAPKNSECKNPLENTRLDFSGMKTASSTFIIFQRATYLRGVLLVSAGAIEGHCEGKTPPEDHQGAIFLHDNAPTYLPGHLHPRRNFQCLDHPPYSPDLVPSNCHLFPELKKTIERSLFSFDAEVIAAAETWLDGQQFEFFFEWLANVRAKAKKCI